MILGASGKGRAELGKNQEFTCLTILEYASNAPE